MIEINIVFEIFCKCHVFTIEVNGHIDFALGIARELAHEELLGLFTNKINNRIEEL